MNEAKNLIYKWHEVVGSDDPLLLENIISEDAIFSSPVVFTPMEGKKITMMYLSAAGQSFNMEKFKYTKEIHDGLNSVLEFETYIDDISDLSTASTTIDLQTIANNNGGIDGDLGYANYSSEVSGVISFAGGIHNINWIDENDEPLVSIHGNNDGTVDYNCATVLGGSTPVNLSLCGSGEMHPRAESVNIINDHLLLNGSDHDWFNSGNGDSRFLDALDFTTDFLFPLLPCNQSTFTINQGLIKKEKIQSLDLLGRKNQNTNLLINIFDDGTTSKQIIIE